MLLFNAISNRITVDNSVPITLPLLQVDISRFLGIFKLLFQDQTTHQPATIEISDNGLGLPSDAMRSVLDPFFARNEDTHNFGVCLPTTYFLINQHGGSLRVDPNPSGGILFNIRLPLNLPTARNAEK